MSRLRPTVVLLLGGLLLAACAPAPEPAADPTRVPTALPSDSVAPAPSAAAEAGDLACVIVAGEAPLCGRQAAPAPGPDYVPHAVIFRAWETPHDGTRSAAGGIREVCISATPPAGIELALRPLGDRELPLGTEPVCLTGPGGEPVEGLRFMGDLTRPGEGQCGSCWAFSVTPEALLFRAGDGSEEVRTVEIPAGATRDVEFPGDVLAIAYEVRPDGTAGIVID